MFSTAAAYERFMGRWSAHLAPLFVQFGDVRDGDRLLDVGSGTGSLTRALAAAAPLSQIVGIDPASLPGDQPAKKSKSSPTTGVVHVNDGIPDSDQRSLPVLTS